MRNVMAAVTLMSLAGAAAGQVTNHDAAGNLALTVDPGCIGFANAGPELSPPDLGLGMLACARKDDWDGAVELLVLMQLRAEFDKARVADPTAHQAEDVLSMQMTGALPPGGQEKLGAAFERFGDSGGPRHSALCEVATVSGPPTHDPAWMVRHGIGAFTDPDGEKLVPGFDAQAAWSGIMKNYLKCE